MAYQPTYPSPYMEAIDATQENGNIFKCLINPKDTILDAFINIYNNDTTNERLIYTSSQESLSGTAPRIITYVHVPIDLYYELEQRTRRGEILSIRIVDGNNNIYTRTIRQMDCPIYGNTNIFIYLDNTVSTNSTSYQWFIYSNILDNIRFADGTFPFKGGLSDDSWLSCDVKTPALSNGEDYKWNISLKTDESKTIDRNLSAITPVATGGWSSNLDFTNNIYCSLTENLLAQCMYAIHQDACFITINSEKRRVINIPTDYNNVIIGNETFFNVKCLELEKPLSKAYSHKDTFFISQSFDELASHEYYFKARKTPVVAFDVPAVINSSSHIFKATYSQEQMVGVAYFQYDLFKNGVEIASSGKVFTQDITYTFDNLVSGTEYDVVLTIVNNDGVELREERRFAVEYPSTSSVIAPVLSLNNKTGCISVDFDNNASIPATVGGGDTVEHKSFGVIDQPSNYSVVSSGKILEGSTPDKLIVDDYPNIKTDMYISVDGETVRVSHCENLDDAKIELQVEPSLQTEDVEGLPYEVLSFFNGIHLADNQSILWDTIGGNPLEFPDDSSQVVHWHGNHGFNGVIVEKINSELPLGSTVVSYDGMNFSYKLGTEDIVNFCPYLGLVSAIAGNNEHSGVSHVVEFDPASPLSFKIDKAAIESKFLPETEEIDGLSVQINNESRTVTSLEDDGNNLSVTIDRAFLSDISTETMCVIYDENYLYVLSDDDEIQDDDILIDNDLSYKYWWLIVLLPDEVQFIKTVPFLDVTQNINLTESEV